MDQLESVHKVKEWSKGPPTYYLGHDYKRDKRGKWWIGCKKYLDEAIKTIEKYSGIWLRGVIQKRLLPYFRRKSTQQLSDVNWYFKLGNMPWPHRHCLCSIICLSFQCLSSWGPLKSGSQGLWLFKEKQKSPHHSRFQRSNLRGGCRCHDPRFYTNLPHIVPRCNRRNRHKTSSSSRWRNWNNRICWLQSCSRSRHPSLHHRHFDTGW